MPPLLLERCCFWPVHASVRDPVLKVCEHQIHNCSEVGDRDDHIVFCGQKVKGEGDSNCVQCFLKKYFSGGCLPVDSLPLTIF